MQQLSKSKYITILIHVLAWGLFGFGVFFYLPIFSGLDIHYGLWIRQIITFALLVVAFYINALVLVPKFLLKDKPAHYGAIIIGLIIAIVILDGWNDHLLNLNRFLDEAFLKRVMKQVLAHRGENILQIFTLVISVLVLVISTSMATIWKWQKDKQRAEQLEKEQVTSELSLLKAQINPHFFFNTLNNIYILTQVDANVAGHAVHQLSRMMRYLLYETQQGHTQLSKEIAFVNDYIGLMQLRLTDRVRLNIEIQDRIIDMPMAPMLLLPFLENAFKYGVSTTQESQIDLRMIQEGSKLFFILKNFVLEDNSQRLELNSGIGLVNTRRRLALLYPGKYTLSIDERTAENKYIVHLMLDLS
ncbi:sensor histidine kinase [Pedobacter sp. PWIIR3]